MFKGIFGDTRLHSQSYIIHHICDSPCTAPMQPGVAFVAEDR
jgi:hypothetical protein